ncbi:SpoIIE family protein phosphatase [Crateriforma conspicua]|uniref:Phosphoserine phosphatase RsbU n=1 Tax=Crateriforma conspicua TaxID=2527996 RepID=A0A5C5Y1D9_9PLAN|nr:SpoIIE family protein phosphatase [Crateriforma conspicua]TWT68463.1 Phosphoserine phosphatase RsbU [Crateriforma conspicua]
MAFLSCSSRIPGQADAAPAERFELTEAVTTIGRHPDCTIVVEAGAVSRFHARILHTDDEFRVEDSGSRNGTFLNGQLIAEPHVLQEGDRVRISDIDFVFHREDVPQFAAGQAMTFDGSSFGIVMVDENETKNEPLPQVQYSSSQEGLKMSATPEAKLAALMRINRNLTGALTLDEVFPKVLESLFEIFPAADRGFIVTQTSEGKLVPQWVKTRRSRDETETVRISRTIIRQVMESREAILSLDAMDDSRFDSSESIADFSIRSMICAPLQDEDGNSIGALQIDSTQGHGQFRDEDVDLLSGVAAQASIVINNARMHQQALAQQEVEQDLRLATEVQQAFLPQTSPDAVGFRVRSFYQAANHIGGDYFDYISLPDGRIGVVVADVVGHGVAAAMYMAKLSAETRFCLASEPDLGKAIEMLNNRMSRLHVERFVTFLLVVIQPNEDRISIVNAGHMPPIVRDCGNGQLCEPGEEESGLPIAIDEGMDYEAVDFQMSTGDLLVMYTDGVNEAMNIADEEFGTDRIKDLTAQSGTADEVKQRIVDAVFEHIGDGDQFDDMCLVVIERISETQPPDGISDTAGEIVDPV